jgi:hypothetical protein
LNLALAVPLSRLRHPKRTPSPQHPPDALLQLLVLQLLLVRALIHLHLLLLMSVLQVAQQLHLQHLLLLPLMLLTCHQSSQPCTAAQCVCLYLHCHWQQLQQPAGSNVHGWAIAFAVSSAVPSTAICLLSHRPPLHPAATAAAAAAANIPAAAASAAVG